MYNKPTIFKIFEIREKHETGLFANPDRDTCPSTAKEDGAQAKHGGFSE